MLLPATGEQRCERVSSSECSTSQNSILFVVNLALTYLLVTSLFIVRLNQNQDQSNAEEQEESVGYTHTFLCVCLNKGVRQTRKPIDRILTEIVCQCVLQYHPNQYLRFPFNVHHCNPCRCRTWRGLTVFIECICCPPPDPVPTALLCPWQVCPSTPRLIQHP